MLQCSVARAGRGGNWFLVIPSEHQLLPSAIGSPVAARGTINTSAALACQNWRANFRLWGRDVRRIEPIHCCQ
jgi:hypothetical protein